MNLTRIQAVRALVLDIEKWGVEQHPLNRPFYDPPRPCPGNLIKAQQEWEEASRALPWAESRPLMQFEPGVTALWSMPMPYGWIVPVRLVRPHLRQDRVWWVERLDDPPIRVLRGQTPVGRRYAAVLGTLREFSAL